MKEYRKALFDKVVSERRKAYEQLERKVIHWMINSNTGAEFYRENDGHINYAKAFDFYINNVKGSFRSHPEHYVQKIAAYQVPEITNAFVKAESERKKMLSDKYDSEASDDYKSLESRKLNYIRNTR